MANINAMALKFSAVVTFTDGSNGILHGQYQDGIAWSISGSDSFATEAQVANSTPNLAYKTIIDQAFGLLPLVASFSFTSTAPHTQLTVNGIVGRLDVLIATDDQKHYSYAVVINGLENDVYAETPTGFVGLGNGATYKANLQTMVNQAMQTATVS